MSPLFVERANAGMPYLSQSENMEYYFFVPQQGLDGSMGAINNSLTAMLQTTPVHRQKKFLN
jgi:hypothetical protein